MKSRKTAGSLIFPSHLVFLAIAVASVNLSFGQSPQSASADDNRGFVADVGRAGRLDSATIETPQLTSITTTPNPAVNGQAFRFTITGTGFDPNSATVRFNGPGCPGYTCSFTSGSLTSTSTQLSGIAMLSTGAFTVTVANGASGSASNALILSVFDSSAGAPQLSAITTSPAPPVNGQAFTFTITGSGFDSNNPIVIFSGPGCAALGCTYTVGSLSGTATQLTGTAMLGGGTFTVKVKNGSSGALSNGLTLTVSGNTIGTPQISKISTSPDPPTSAQAFTFTIQGAFDPNTVIVNFQGRGCPASMPCTVGNSALTSKDLAHLSGTVALVSGTFTVTVQNGPSGTPSNGLPLTVTGPASGTPQVLAITTSPSPPVNAQAFTFSITGVDFDPSSATVVFDGPGCSLSSTTCNISNAALLSKTASELDGVAILTGGSFAVTVQNSSGATSNSTRLVVSGTPGAPLLNTISTSPDPPLAAQPFTFTIAGTGFDPNNAIVIFDGPGCTNSKPCTVPNNALASATFTQLAGTITLPGGSFTVTVQNGLSGVPSTGLTLSVLGTTNRPQLNAITTLPDPPVEAQGFTFAITGSGFDPNNAIVVFNGPGCGAATTCLIENNVLLSKSSTELDGVAVLAGGSFVVTVLNGPASAISNSLALTVTAHAVPFQLSGITTSPSPPVGGQEFTFTVNGTGLNPNNAQVEFSGPGCTPCLVANSALSNATDTSLSGTITLSAGNYTVLVQNGSGPLSNGISLAVTRSSLGATRLTAITTTPNPPISGQAFGFSISGTAFDPNSVLVTFTGPGCSPCTISNTALSAVTSTNITGRVTLSDGNYTVTTQNGTTDTPSNGLSLTVSKASGIAPHIDVLVTTPTQPVDGQMFTFSITGTGFDSATAVVSFTGPNCTPCLVTHGALASTTATQVSGSTTLAAGNYTLVVQNGSSGAPSNGQSLSVAAPAGTTPHIIVISTAPALPVNAQPLTFTITGSGFDPASAMVVLIGPNCAPCSISNASLSSSTSTQLIGTATLTTGSYIATVQNASGDASNSLQLIVYPNAGAAPHLDVSITTPRSPVHGQETIFIIFGSGFDPDKIMVSFSGPGCTEATCVIPHNQVAVNFSITAIGGIVTFPAAGTFNVVAQNGPTGSASNPLTITVQ